MFTTSPAWNLSPSPVVVSAGHNKSECSLSCCHITVDREVLGITDFHHLETILLVLVTSSQTV